jgi:hypothetical protein
MRQPAIVDAVLSLVPDAQVVVRGDVVEWLEPAIAPVTDEQIAAELASLTADYEHSLTVPQEVTMRQARLALLAAGKLDDVAAAIDGMSEPDKTAAAITWEYSQSVQRQNPFVLTLGAALGLDSAALDALFVAAAEL